MKHYPKQIRNRKSGVAVTYAVESVSRSMGGRIGCGLRFTTHLAMGTTRRCVYRRCFALWTAPIFWSAAGPPIPRRSGGLGDPRFPRRIALPLSPYSPLRHCMLVRVRGSGKQKRNMMMAVCCVLCVCSKSLCGLDSRSGGMTSFWSQSFEF